MITNKFKAIDGDYDFSLFERVIQGRLTKSRFKIINKVVKKWNYNHEAPYGYSMNGYPYRCGCEHDCCGCLSSENISVELQSINKDKSEYRISLKLNRTYNY